MQKYKSLCLYCGNTKIYNSKFEIDSRCSVCTDKRLKITPYEINNVYGYEDIKEDDYEDNGNRD